VAAQAEQDAADFLASRGNPAGQNFGEAAVVAERDRGAIQRAGVLAPQCVAAGIGTAGVAGTERAAVRGVTARATATAIVMRAEDVNG
jgi:hypothetical protein